MIQNEIRPNLSAGVPMRINQRAILGTWGHYIAETHAIFIQLLIIYLQRKAAKLLGRLFHSPEGLKTGE